MKRDLELIRNILIAVKMFQNQFDLPLLKEILGFSTVDAVTFYQHVVLLSEAGLVTTKKVHNDLEDFLAPTHLTISGCGFLENIQIEKIWSRLLVLDSKENSSLGLILLVPLANFYSKELKSLI